MQRHEYEAFAAALADPGAAVPAGVVSPPGAPADERFAVYRNNVHVAFIDALEAGFPVACGLLGRECFRDLARAYVSQELPRGLSAQEHGAHFAGFIDRFPAASRYGWLPDVVALEWAWQESWGAAEAHALTLADLARQTAEALCACRIRPHPAARLLRSRWPVAAIWQFHQQQVQDLGSLVWQPEDVLVTRPEADVQVHGISPGTATLAHALLAGLRVEDASAQALSAEPGFDTGAGLATLIECGFAMEMINP